MEYPVYQSVQNKLDFFIASKKVPHIIFYGPSGTGKRTIVNKFLYRIYGGDKQHMKTNVMFVNCAHGKGIKFIRNELKFFAKSNIQVNSGVVFKSIVLLNADFLTIDAQSALRRCIELFSLNTRFFIIIENKDNLLNPILSRFCDIYIPEVLDYKQEVVNLHKNTIRNAYHFECLQNSHKEQLDEKMRGFDYSNHRNLVNNVSELYYLGYSCLDIIEWCKAALAADSCKATSVADGCKAALVADGCKAALVADGCKAPPKTTPIGHLTEKDISELVVVFSKIKSEYRCEKLLMLYIMDYIFLRKNKDLKNIGFM